MAPRESCLIVTISLADTMERDVFQYVPVGDKGSRSVGQWGQLPSINFETVGALPPPPISSENLFSFHHGHNFDIDVLCRRQPANAKHMI